MKRRRPRAARRSKVTAAARHVVLVDAAQAALPWCLSIGETPPPPADHTDVDAAVRRIADAAVALAFDIAEVFVREADAQWTGPPA